MSVMRCDHCSRLVDTDTDLESLYVEGRDCLCQWCREKMDEPSEGEKE